MPVISNFLCDRGETVKVAQSAGSGLAFSIPLLFCAVCTASPSGAAVKCCGQAQPAPSQNLLIQSWAALGYPLYFGISGSSCCLAPEHLHLIPKHDIILQLTLRIMLYQELLFPSLLFALTADQAMLRIFISWFSSFLLVLCFYPMSHHQCPGCTFASVWGPDFQTISLKAVDSNRFSLIQIIFAFCTRSHKSRQLQKAKV